MSDDDSDDDFGVKAPAFATVAATPPKVEAPVVVEQPKVQAPLPEEYSNERAASTSVKELAI